MLNTVTGLSSFSSEMRLIGMLSNEKKVVTFFFTILTVLLGLGTCLAETLSANFVFGDSLVEVGNNNYITSLSKANYMPNGIDFGMPTGRYTNGRTIVDILGKSFVILNHFPKNILDITIYVFNQMLQFS